MAKKQILALNFQLRSTEDGWYQLLPVGAVNGRDGRAWMNDQPETVISNIIANGVDIPIDINHATELQAPNGDASPAQGWIPATREAMRVNDGYLEVKPEWNSTNPVASKEYRYWSPVLLYNKDDFRVEAVTSVGLTNNPNLYLSALNHQETDPSHEDSPMLKQLLAALGLPEDTDAQTALNAIQKLKDDKDTALNSAKNPSLDKFVPRSDYDTALNRAQTAEQALADKDKAEKDSKIETAINAALKAGKITPASVDYHKAACAEEGGLERFEQYVESAPEVAANANLGDKPPAGTGKALNAEEKQVADMMGISDEDWQKAKESK